MQVATIQTDFGAPDLPTVNGTHYPAQFLLGLGAGSRIQGWQDVPIANGFSLAVHPELACVQVQAAGKELTLVGNILDPLAPQADNHAIVRGLLDQFTHRQALIAATARYGGRWLIIGAEGEQCFLFHDALGLRQVFFSDPAVTGAVWAMSQPGMARDVLGMELDTDATAFMHSYAFRIHAEHRWPGEASPIRGLKHLLPNHWLDLRSGASHRYWPAGTLQRMSAAEAIDRLARLLPGMVEAAAARFDLALGLTAGLDSRLVLAAARRAKDGISFITVRQGKAPDDHVDLVVPERLLARLGLPHEVIRAPHTKTPEFSHAFKRAVYLAHDNYGPDAEAILKQFGRNKAALTGSGAEVGRCSFREYLPRGGREPITPVHLSKLQHMGEEPFALRHFERWLEDARQRHGIHVLDLFEWEQGHGNWLAMTQLEFDIAWKEIITPYNCREILETLLAVPERQRCAPKYRLFEDLIRKLWPEVLSEPINPEPEMSALHRVVRKLRKLRAKYRSH